MSQRDKTGGANRVNSSGVTSRLASHGFPILKSKGGGSSVDSEDRNEYLPTPGEPPIRFLAFAWRQPGGGGPFSLVRPSSSTLTCLARAACSMATRREG